MTALSRTTRRKKDNDVRRSIDAKRSVAKRCFDAKKNTFAI